MNTARRRTRTAGPQGVIMPRTELTPFIGKQTRWKGIIGKFGKRLSRGDEQRNTVLLENVREVETQIEIDHSWITGGRWSEGLHVGDVIYFDALVCPYRRGDFFARWDDAPIVIDYKLINPKHVVVAKRREQ